MDGCPRPLPIPPVCTCLPCICAIHLVIQQILIEPLLWTRPWSRPGDTALNGADKAPGLMELTFWWGRLMSQHVQEQRVLEVSHSRAAHMQTHLLPCDPKTQTGMWTWESKEQALPSPGTPSFTSPKSAATIQQRWLSAAHRSEALGKAGPLPTSVLHGLQLEPARWPWLPVSSGPPSSD